jgi:hypothetical protein
MIYHLYQLLVAYHVMGMNIVESKQYIRFYITATLGQQLCVT